MFPNYSSGFVSKIYFDKLAIFVTDLPCARPYLYKTRDFDRQFFQRTNSFLNKPDQVILIHISVF